MIISLKILQKIQIKNTNNTLEVKFDDTLIHSNDNTNFLKSTKFCFFVTQICYVVRGLDKETNSALTFS